MGLLDGHQRTHPMSVRGLAHHSTMLRTLVHVTSVRRAALRARWITSSVAYRGLRMRSPREKRVRTQTVPTERDATSRLFFAKDECHRQKRGAMVCSLSRPPMPPCVHKGLAIVPHYARGLCMPQLQQWHRAPFLCPTGRLCNGIGSQHSLRTLPITATPSWGKGTGRFCDGMGHGREDAEAFQQCKKTACDLPHSPRFDHTPARFAAVVHTVGVHGHHLFKVIPLRVRGLKTFWTIAPREVSGFDG